MYKTALLRNSSLAVPLCKLILAFPCCFDIHFKNRLLGIAGGKSEITKSPIFYQHYKRRTLEPTITHAFVYEYLSKRLAPEQMSPHGRTNKPSISHSPSLFPSFIHPSFSSNHHFNASCPSFCIFRPCSSPPGSFFLHINLLSYCSLPFLANPSAVELMYGKGEEGRKKKHV